MVVRWLGHAEDAFHAIEACDIQTGVSHRNNMRRWYGLKRLYLVWK
jgi:hypothetical protein